MKPKLGLALGSGSARGWAHISAAYADGDLDQLEQWVSGLAWKEVLGLLDVGFSGGLIKGEKLFEFFQRHFVDHDFASLPVPFACVFSRPRQSNGELLPSMAGVLLTPRLGHLALMDYHRGSEAIAEGRAAVIRMLPAIQHALSS